MYSLQFPSQEAARQAAKERAEIAGNPEAKRKTYLEEHSPDAVYDAIGEKYQDNPTEFDKDITDKGYIMEGKEGASITEEEKENVLSIVLNSGNKFKFDKLYEYYYNECFYILHHQYIMFKYWPKNRFWTVQADKEHPEYQSRDTVNTQATINNFIASNPILFKRKANPEEIAAGKGKTPATKTDFNSWAIPIRTWLESVQKFATEKAKGPGFMSRLTKSLTGENSKNWNRKNAASLEKTASHFLEKLQMISSLTSDDVAAAMIKKIKRDIMTFVTGDSLIIDGVYFATIGSGIIKQYGTGYPQIFGEKKLSEIKSYVTEPAVGGYRKKQRKTRRSKKSRKSTRRRSRK